MNCFTLQYQKQALILHYFLFYQEENNTDKTTRVSPHCVSLQLWSRPTREVSNHWRLMASELITQVNKDQLMT